MMKANCRTVRALLALCATVVLSSPGAMAQGGDPGDDLEKELDAASESPPLQESQESIDTELELGGVEPGPEGSAPNKAAAPVPAEPAIEGESLNESSAQAAPLPPADAPVQAGATPPAAGEELSLEDPAPPAAPSDAGKTAERKTPSKEDEGSGLLFDPPNRATEERLHRIYGRNTEPIPEERWDIMISPRKTEVYRIRQGNTLSGISTTLFGDPSYWPKLWSENGNFENPHLIVPGKVVRVVPGSEEDAPAVMLVDPADQAASLDLPPPSYEIDQETAVSPEDAIASTVLEELAPDEPAIPEPEQVARKPMKNLPASFISPDALYSDDYDRTGLEVVKGRAVTVPATLIPTHYWVDELPKGAGYVAEIEASEEIAGVLQNVLVKMKGPASIGQTYSVVLPVQKAGSGPLATGRVLEVGGVVEIMSVADRQENLYRAMVVKTVGAISKGSIVMAEKLPRADLTLRGNLKNLETAVIGGQFENDRKAFAAGSVIYLGAGTASGLAAGDVLAIRSRRGARRGDTKFPTVASPIAIAKVVHSQTNGSTAFLIEAQQEVVPGDRTGGPLPRPNRKMFILDRARVIDIDQEVVNDRARREGFSSWKGKSGGR